MPRASRDTRTRELIVSAEEGDAKGVRKALAAGADPNARGPNSYALHCAAFGGHTAIVKMLLDAGADVSLADAQGFTALHLAAASGRTSILDRLLAAGAPHDAKTPAGGTALHVATASGFTESVAVLLAAGSEVDARDDDQRTPLIEASLGAHRHLVDRLLDAGAAIEVRDAHDITPLLAAITRAQASVGASWSTSGKVGRKKVEYAFECGVLRMTRDGATEVLPLDEQREIAELEWATPMLGTYLRAIDIALLLLERGADPQVVRLGNSALHAAARLGEPRLLEPMLARADTSIRNVEGATLLHVAALSRRPDGLAMLLERCPALTDVRDEFGWTPAHYLCDVGGPDAMFDLLHGAGLDFSAASTKARGDVLAAGATPIDVAQRWHDDHALAQITRVTAGRSAAKKPAAKKPAAKKPAAKKPAAKKPAAKKPAAKQPAAKQPAAKKPAAKKPAAKKTQPSESGAD